MGDKMKKKVLILLIISLILLVNIDLISAADYNNYEEATVSCGAGMLDKIPTAIPKVVSIVYKVIQIAVPVVLVVIGSLDLAKSITSEKEDEIKKSQKLFIKRLISAGLVFFVFSGIKFLISLVADDTKDKNNIIDCAECFINNECK